MHTGTHGAAARFRFRGQIKALKLHHHAKDDQARQAERASDRASSRLVQRLALAAHELVRLLDQSLAELDALAQPLLRGFLLVSLFLPLIMHPPHTQITPTEDAQRPRLDLVAALSTIFQLLHRGNARSSRWRLKPSNSDALAALNCRYKTELFQVVEDRDIKLPPEAREAKRRLRRGLISSRAVLAEYRARLFALGQAADDRSLFRWDRKR